MAGDNALLAGKTVHVFGTASDIADYAMRLQEFHANVKVHIVQEDDWKKPDEYVRLAGEITNAEPKADAVVILRPDMMKSLEDGFREQPVMKFAVHMELADIPMVIMDNDVSQAAKRFLSGYGAYYYNIAEAGHASIQADVFEAIEKNERRRRSGKGGPP